MALGRLSAEEWQRLQQAADALADAWEREGTARLEDFAPPPGDPLRPVALRELVKTDLEMRWRKGAPKLIEEYLAEHAELAGEGDVSTSLVYEEYRARQLYGDKPTLANYATRFPRLADDLNRLAEVGISQPLGLTPATFTPRMGGGEGPQSFENLVPVPGYRLLNNLGSGGFGHVWRAEAPGGVEVAVKVIFRPFDHADAQRELEALELIKRLRHPFLLRMQAFWALEDRIVIVMDLADGSLRDRLKECKLVGLPSIPEDELLSYFREAAEALDFLHASQVQHRDVKPDNLLVQGRHALLADFGLARVLSSRRLSTATACGTPGYLPPECWYDKVSRHTDQYSLAASYAEMRLARKLFPSRELRDLMLDHLEHWPNLDALGEAEQSVLYKALAKQPEQRFASCSAFVQALHDACKKGTPVEDVRRAPSLREQTPFADRPKGWVGRCLSAGARWLGLGE